MQIQPERADRAANRPPTETPAACLHSKLHTYGRLGKTMLSDDIARRIETFRADLYNPGIPIIDIVRGRIAHGIPYIFDRNDAEYFRFKQTVSDYFKVHPDRIKIVGSAQLGFSIAPHKLWSPFHQESDIDVAVTDPVCFLKFWRNLLQYNLDIKARSTKDDERYRRFLSYHFQGWIRPDLLPMEYSQPWFGFFRSMHSSFEGRNVAGALYYDEGFFEAYHTRNLSELRATGRK